LDNNLFFRQLRYVFDLNEKDIVQIFAKVEQKLNNVVVKNWLRKEHDENFSKLTDKHLANFLNGFIILKRGKKGDEIPRPEKKLTNNIILRKLKIALNLKGEDILVIMKMADLKFSIHEINAFFRKPGQNQYRECKDQFLRNFLFGLKVKYRSDEFDI